MIVHIVRHGIAIDREDPKCPPDPERFLTAEGIRKTKAVAKGVRKLGVEPEALISSPYVRALQTAEIFAKVLGIPVKKIRQTPALEPDKQPAVFFRELAKLKAEVVMAFGHAPNVDELIAHVVHTESDIWNMKKAGVACLDVYSFSPLRGELLWLATPKMLGKL